MFALKTKEQIFNRFCTVGSFPSIILNFWQPFTFHRWRKFNILNNTVTDFLATLQNENLGKDWIF